MKYALTVSLSVVLAWAGCSTPSSKPVKSSSPVFWYESAPDDDTLVATVRLLTPRAECVCRLHFDHASHVIVATSDLRFQVESPAEFAGREITVSFAQWPSSYDPFTPIFEHPRVALTLPKRQFSVASYSAPGTLQREFTALDRR